MGVKRCVIKETFSTPQPLSDLRAEGWEDEEEEEDEKEEGKKSL